MADMTCDERRIVCGGIRRRPNADAGDMSRDTAAIVLTMMRDRMIEMVEGMKLNQCGRSLDTIAILVVHSIFRTTSILR